MQRQVLIAGVGYSEVGRDLGRTEGALAGEAIQRALADAGMTVDDVDGITAFPERVASTFEGPHVNYVMRMLGMRDVRYYQSVPFYGGAAQMSAVVTAAYAIIAGAADVIVSYRAHLRQQGPFYGAARSSGALTEAPDDLAYRGPYGVLGGAVRYGLWAQRYLHVYGRTENDLAEVVLLSREHAQRNPRAIWRGQPLTRDDYFRSRMISSPLRVLDCDFPIDGAVAVVLARADRAPGLPHRPVYIESAGHATDGRGQWELWPDLEKMQSRQIATQLWARTTLTPADVDVAELYDGFSFLTLTWLEDLGFCGPGEGGDFISQGHARLGGRLPTNTDGGQLGGGRLHGFGKIAEAVLQLRGECDDRQVNGAEVAVVTNGGGPLGGAMLLTV